MRPTARVLTLVGMLLVVGAAFAADREVKIGAKVEDLRFKDIRYLARSLDDFGEKKAFVLVFIDTACPLVQQYLPVAEPAGEGVPRQGRAVPRRQRRRRDTIAAMAAQAVEYDVEFPFVKDADCRVADALGVTRTPEVSSSTPSRNLRYRGRIDDQYRLGGQRPSRPGTT